MRVHLCPADSSQSVQACLYVRVPGTRVGMALGGAALRAMVGMAGNKQALT